MSNSFAELGLPEQLITTLASREIVSPYPIQASTIPVILDGRDVCGRAPTGSGKTLAFGLPVMARLGRGRPRRPRGLILAPTRELAEQITTELRPLAKASGRSMVAVYGGVGYGGQRARLHQGVDLVVACPGRLEDFIAQGDVRLEDVDLVVIDEADRMADMGFLPAVKRILDMTSSRRQTVLFSATLDGDVATLTERYQRDPVRRESDVQQDAPGDAEHVFWKVDRADRVAHTADIIGTASPSIVFTRTRHGADRLARQLKGHGVEAVAMHGGRSQSQRNRALKDFSTGRAKALIATDVAARGIHVQGVASVVHFDPPEDEKTYVHRSGRTARAGESGLVVSLVDGSQFGGAKKIQRFLGLEGQIVERSGANSHHKPDTRAPETRPSRVESTVYVGNLPYSVTESELVTMFRDHGPVRSASIVTHKQTGRSRGFGFVILTEQKAAGAIKALDGRSHRGRRLNVREASTRP
jgi:superfamily II DNA/RNA helicase